MEGLPRNVDEREDEVVGVRGDEENLCCPADMSSPLRSSESLVLLRATLYDSDISSTGRGNCMYLHLSSSSFTRDVDLLLNDFESTWAPESVALWSLFLAE